MIDNPDTGSEPWPRHTLIVTVRMRVHDLVMMSQLGLETSPSIPSHGSIEELAANSPHSLSTAIQTQQSSLVSSRCIHSSG